ncbi:hypothetical protein O9929_28130 [Vibrio lentus]|nr:hypothetical protein [Vibrio lentus]
MNRYSASASRFRCRRCKTTVVRLSLAKTFLGIMVQQHRSLNHIYDLFDKELGYVQYTIQKFYRINGGSTQNGAVQYRYCLSNAN